MRSAHDDSIDTISQQTKLDSGINSTNEAGKDLDNNSTIQNDVMKTEKPSDTKTQSEDEIPKHDQILQIYPSNNEEEEKKQLCVENNDDSTLKQGQIDETVILDQEEEDLTKEGDKKLSLSALAAKMRKVQSKQTKTKAQGQSSELLQLTITRRLGDGKINKSEIKIACWNVNGLRARLKNGTLSDYLANHDLDIFCINETKLNAEWIADETNHSNFSSEYHIFLNTKRNGYSGTGICTKFKPISVNYDLGIPEYDQEGRVVTAEFESFYLVVVYTPYSGEELRKLDYRTKEWDPAFRAYVNTLKKKKQNVIILGDLNVAHQEIDLFNPTTALAERIPGFTEEERLSFEALLQAGFVDTFRYLHPTERKYTAWDTRIKEARKDMKGWRLDYILVSQEFLPAVKTSEIIDDVIGSDHCPIQLIIDPNPKEK